MKTALVTGSSGFIGWNFVKHLESREYTVHGIDVQPPTYQDACSLFTPGRYRRRYDLVVHAAAVTPHRAAIDSSHGLIARNTELDAAMFRWVIETQQPNVIYFSSSAVYSNDVSHPTLGGRMMDFAGTPFGFYEYQGDLHHPFDDYGVTKRHGERMAAAAQRCGVNVTVLRPFSGYGTNQTPDFPFGAFIRRALNQNDPFTIWGDADQARDFVHVDDIVECALAVNEAKYHGPVNVCTGKPTSMRTLASLIINTYNTIFPAANYHPYISVDPDAPMGVRYRVGDPTLMKTWHEPRVTLEEGVHRAIKELTE